MRSAEIYKTKVYQNHLFEILKFYFKENVKKEWSSAAGATDVFRHREALYAPRVDIAVGPFNTTLDNFPQNHREITLFGGMNPLIQRLINFGEKPIGFNGLNQNPRCLLAIEMSFSGSSKHILGDFANASLMGLVGIVVSSRKNYKKVHKMANYLKIVTKLGKIQDGLFSNLLVFEYEEFIAFLYNKKKEVSASVPSVWRL